MHILVLLTDAFGGRGGIAQFNRDFLSALSSYPGVKEVVVVPRLKPDPVGTLPLKLTFVDPGLPSKWRFILNTFKTVVRNPRFDLIICGHIHLLPVTVLLKALFFKAPLFLLLYGVDAWSPSRHRFSNRLISCVDGTIAISEVTQKRFLSWSGLHKKTHFILPPAIDFQKFSFGSPDRGLRERYGLNGKTVVMSLARLSSEDRYKGIDEILEVLPELVKKIPNLIYLIAGDGDDKPRLEQKVRHLNVEKHVLFTGFISESEKMDTYRLADAFVMPGRGEGFGIVYLEAMACGVPVVGSKTDGGAEALQNGKLGIMVDPNSPDEIKNGILEAIRRPKGTVPAGLEEFSFPNFEKRFHGIVGTILK